MLRQKYSALVSVLMIMLLLLSACSGGGAGGGTANQPAADPAASEEMQELLPEEGAKLTVWDSGDQKIFIEAAAKAFKEKYNVDVTFAELGPDKSMGQIVTDGPAGVGADVFAGVHDQIGQGVSAGVLMPNGLV